MTHFDRVGVYEYPDKYVIVTIDTLAEGGGIHTERISVAPKDISDLKFSELILKHLRFSKSGIKYFDVNKNKMEFIKATGFKTMKAQMKNSKFVAIDRIEGKYSVGPTINGGTSGPKRGYHFTKEAFEFNSPKIITEIGIKVKKGLELSK